ncbi:MAG: hypothetical protein II931_02820 [Clostridia bacterium]|nr:hypothetical protein [Clostridia bacterium]
MSATVWLIIAIILFTLAGALFTAAVIMFFVMDIPGIIGDLSGRTLAKGIQNIRNESAYAHSRNAKAANRRINPSRPFSIGSDYAKDKGYAVPQLAHASRRLDRNTLRGESTPAPDSADNGHNRSAASNNQYTQTTTMLDNLNNQYTQATSVLDNSNNQYTQATTVLDNSNNQYTQATTVLDNSNNQYMQATTVPGGSGSENPSDTIINSYYNEYTQGTTILSESPDSVPENPNEQYRAVPPLNAKSDLPLGFRVVRRVSVTHCSEVI